MLIDVITLFPEMFTGVFGGNVTLHPISAQRSFKNFRLFVAPKEISNAY